MLNLDNSKQLALIVNDAIKNKQPLKIFGGNSKSFYGPKSKGEPVCVAEHCGVINYQPEELVLTVRAGTTLSEIESILAEQNQKLIFEPPHFGAKATIGGAISSDINGPSSPWFGSVRDAVLGVKIINGQGEILHFGGEVMKNVAGYDVSRLMVGSMGTLGLLLEISLRILPLEKKTITFLLETTEEEAIQRCSQLNRQHLPLSAMVYYNNLLYIRLSGNIASVNSAYKTLGGELLTDNNFWYSIREHTHPFFYQTGTLWRISVPPATPPINDLDGHWLIDWGGAQRWFISDMAAEVVYAKVADVHGHATIYRNIDSIGDVFHPLTTSQRHLHKMVKQAFDPHRIFNPGRLYADL
ncbi:MAG: glycolate oxidase subunit GlcE [Methylophaga sp.]|nr:MAG: glycolate oxidase subunit GlcE [Methylophaga sp.]